MLDGRRILVPKGARRKIIEELHRAHSGLTKTLKTARQLCFWLNVKEELRKAIDPCQHNQEDRPAQARQTLKGLLPPASVQPMLHVATDLFDLYGDAYIILVDRYSGYSWTEKLRRTDTRSICETLTRWFTEFGWPTYIRTDGGPQFCGEFREYCVWNVIKHKLASAYSPESNGLAKTAVKNMKSLLSRCIWAKENIPMAIAVWQNMARDDGQLPSQLFLSLIHI